MKNIQMNLFFISIRTSIGEDNYNNPQQMKNYLNLQPKSTDEEFVQQLSSKGFIKNLHAAFIKAD